MNFAKKVEQQVSAGYFISFEDKLENSQNFGACIFQILAQLLDVATFSGLTKLVFKLILVYTTVVEKLWALKDSHLSRGDCMKMGNLIFTWDASLEVVIDHLITLIYFISLTAVLNTLHLTRAGVNLIQIFSIVTFDWPKL